MKGEFSRSTFSARMRYGNVTMQQGRVQLDTDWDEKSELQLRGDLVYLDVWERDVRSAGDASLLESASGGPDVRRRPLVRGSDDQPLRLVREVDRSGVVSSLLHAELGRSAGRAGESFRLPDVEVTVEGKPWTKVDSLSGSGPLESVYAIKEEGGAASVTFGNGKNGARPAEGSRIVASYRFGGGGNAPEAEPVIRKHIRRTKK